MDEKPIGYRLREMAKLFEEAVRAKAGRNGIGSTDFLTLHFLRHFRCECPEKTVSQSDLCHFLHVKPPTASVALQNLEAQGLIVRRKAEHDSRVTLVELSEKGMSFLEGMRHFFSEVDDLVEQSLSPEELKIFLQCLEKMSAALRKEASL